MPFATLFAANFGKNVITDFNANSAGAGHDVTTSKSVFDKNVNLSALDKNDFHFA